MNRQNEVFLPRSMSPPITKIQCIIGTNNGPCDLVFLGSVSMPTLNKTISGLVVPAHAVIGRLHKGPTGITFIFHCTANIFKVIFTVLNCVRISTVISLYSLHFIAAPGTV